MRRLLLCLFVFAPPTVDASPLAKFGWFADIVGACWDGVFPDGKTRHRHCYTSQFDQFIRGTASLLDERDGQPAELFAGDSLFAWNASSQRIDYYIWGSDGSHAQHAAMYVDGGDLAFPMPAKDAPDTVGSRSLWHRLDADSFAVHREIPAGDGWKRTLTVTYRRAPLQ